MLGDRKVRYGDSGAVDRLYTWTVRLLAAIGLFFIVGLILLAVGIAHIIPG